jgi:hypothetical protein
MSGRPAHITQVEIERGIRAARKQGAGHVIVRSKLGGEVVIPLSGADYSPPNERNEWDGAE